MTPTPTTTASTPRSATPLVAVVAVVLAALAAVTLTLNATHHSSYRQEGAARADALAVGRQMALSFTTVDYHDLPGALANVTRLGDAKFTQSFTNDFNGAGDQIIKAKGVSKGVIQAAAVQNLSSQAAQVIVAIDVTSTNKDAPNGTTAPFRLSVSLVRQQQRWLVDAVNEQ